MEETEQGQGPKNTGHGVLSKASTSDTKKLIPEKVKLTRTEERHKFYVSHFKEGDPSVFRLRYLGRDRAEYSEEYQEHLPLAKTLGGLTYMTNRLSMARIMTRAYRGGKLTLRNKPSEIEGEATFDVQTHYFVIKPSPEPLNEWDGYPNLSDIAVIATHYSQSDDTKGHTVRKAGKLGAHSSLPESSFTPEVERSLREAYSTFLTPAWSVIRMKTNSPTTSPENNTFCDMSAEVKGPFTMPVADFLSEPSEGLNPPSNPSISQKLRTVLGMKEILPSREPLEETGTVEPVVWLIPEHHKDESCFDIALTNIRVYGDPGLSRVDEDGREDFIDPELIRATVTYHRR